MLFEDVGPVTVEDEPRPANFREAARLLARISRTATENLDSCVLPADVYQANYLSQQRLIDDLAYVTNTSDKELEVIPWHIRKLYRDFPTSLVHNDYHIKNLVIQRGRLTPVDWPGAHLGPHLGDLYALLGETANNGVARDEVVEAYVSELGGANIREIKWQIEIGGTCWLIRTLRWLIEVGAPAIPIMRPWLPDLAKDLSTLVRRLG